MLCAHCGIANHVEFHNGTRMGKVLGLSVAVVGLTCAQCYKRTLAYFFCNEDPNQRLSPTSEAFQFFPLPSLAGSRTAPPEVPAAAASDYNEAAQVLAISPKASAALSRRCLQYVLSTAGNFSQRDLVAQIDAAIAAPGLSQPIKDALHAVRVIGNFAAHPTKNHNTGEIVEVEPGEADWNLDTLESVFDHYYVQPAALKAKKDALNAKLKAAGKPTIA